MSEHNFFDNVFDDPEEDPLLGDDPSSSEGNSPESAGDPGAPSWMDAENNQGAQEGRAGGDSREKEVVVDQRADHRQDLDEINRAVRHGWEVVRLSLRNPNETAGTGRASHQFVAVLRQEGPQSLFDF